MLIEAGLNDFADFSPIPPAEYNLVIKEPMEVKQIPNEVTDIGGKKYTFIIWPEIADGEQAGKRVRRQLSNGSKASRYFLVNFLQRIGVAVTESGAFDSTSIPGRRFKATIKERPYVDKNTGEQKKASDFDDDSIVAM